MPFKPLFRGVLLALALSTSGLLGACATFGEPPANRQLPALPPYVRAVEVQDPKAGEQILIVAGRERLGRVQANCIIHNVSDWYERVRKVYAGEITPEDLEKGVAAKCPAPARKAR